MGWFSRFFNWLTNAAVEQAKPLLGEAAKAAAIAAIRAELQGSRIRETQRGARASAALRILLGAVESGDADHSGLLAEAKERVLAGVDDEVARAALLAALEALD